jgi:ferrous-iron efflux pump FieF
MKTDKPAKTALPTEASREIIAGRALITRLIAVALTLGYALLSNSLALWADLASTVIGFLALLTAWLTLRHVRQSKGVGYAFGHGRLESISSLGISVLMLLSFMLILGTAIWQYAHPAPAIGFGIWLGLASNAAYGLINGYIVWRNLLLERKIFSPTVTAQRRLYTFQTTSNLLMVVALTLMVVFSQQTWTYYIDPTVSVILAFTLLFSATKTFRSSALNLLDRVLEERSQILILRALAEHFEDYQALHGIRTRSSAGRSYVELFLEFDPAKTMGEVQETVDHLQERIVNLLERTEVLIVPTRHPPPGAA